MNNSPIVNNTRDEKEDHLLDLLWNAAPKKMIQYIDALEQDKDHDFSDITSIAKRIFVFTFIRELNVPVRKFRSTLKRYKTELYAQSGIIIGISKKDSKDMDTAYVKLYDNHKDLFIELYDKHAPEPKVSEGSEI